ncbi:MAG: branched chain amino acid ABC transporter substrate-binding protein [Proteobacteria bacterium]|nr:MAG: branched chain amino acid ABC transporter substrate-binding protein [Pseudomonadota bacterium]
MKNIFLKASVGIVLASSLIAGDTITIGVQAPITGKYANEGQSIDNGVKLMVDEYNKKGGILGKKIKVVSCDDEGVAQKAAICARKLANEGVLAVIGSYTSGATEAAQTTYYRSKILQTSDGTSDSLTKHKYWTFFRNSFQNSAQATFTANYLVNDRKFKRIALLSDYSSYSTGLTDSVAKAIKDIKGNIVYEGKIKSGTQNFTSVLTKIKSLNPDVIYYGGYYVDGGLLRAQQIQLDIKAEFVGGDSNDNPDFLKLAGKSAVGAILINFPTPEFLPYDIAKEYLKNYKAKYGIDVASIWTLMNVDGLRTILYAADQIKSFDTKKISDFLHTLKDFQGITGPVSFNSDGERVNTKFNVYQIQSDNSYKILNK